MGGASAACLPAHVHTHTHTLLLPLLLSSPSAHTASLRLVGSQWDKTLSVILASWVPRASLIILQLCGAPMTSQQLPEPSSQQQREVPGPAQPSPAGPSPQVSSSLAQSSPNVAQHSPAQHPGWPDADSKQPSDQRTMWEEEKPGARQD